MLQFLDECPPPGKQRTADNIVPGRSSKPEVYGTLVESEGVLSGATEANLTRWSGTGEWHCGIRESG